MADDVPESSANHFDRVKARAAAKDPDRPGDKCSAPTGTYRPEIDHARCEGKSECLAVCPHDVFEVRTIEPADWAALSLLAKLKVWAHRKQSAYAVRADACKACGLCVVACPEDAIRLVRV